jgi:hypothetical protein
LNFTQDVTPKIPACYLSTNGAGCVGHKSTPTVRLKSLKGGKHNEWSA